MNQLYFKTNYNFNKKIKTIRRIYYGEERTIWTKNSTPLL